MPRADEQCGGSTWCPELCATDQTLIEVGEALRAMLYPEMNVPEGHIVSMLWAYDRWRAQAGYPVWDAVVT